MNQYTINKIEKIYNEIELAFAKIADSEDEKKKFCKMLAQCGIYEQRNGKFMMRVRIPGGELSKIQTRFIFETAKKFGIDNFHITTRQDLQLHDVEIEKILPVAREFLKFGMPFYGGGGDTFRNITSCPFALFSSDAVFDTVPYAQSLTDFLMDYEKAFELPRKFKIAFSCNSKDLSMAKFNDLGFIAKFANGKRGFKVYAGGGMGRESVVGIKIFDFVEDTEIFRIAAAAINMFHELGNRQNRARARFRFVLIEKGEKFFKTQFMKYLQELPPFDPPKIVFQNKKPKIRFARLFIPNGNLNATQFAKIAENIEKYGAEFLRFSQEQDIYVGFPDDESVDSFSQLFPEFSGETLFGLVKSCVGAKVCKIGILDAQSHARAVSEKLNEMIAFLPENKRKIAIERISAMVKISGCHNSCGLNRAVKYGFQGAKKNAEAKILEYYKFQKGASKEKGILTKDLQIEVPANDLPDFVAKLLSEEIKSIGEK